MTPVPSTTTSTKITYNLDDFQIYKGRNDSIAKPSYTWNNDTNTGIYHPANEVIGFVCNGREICRIDSTGFSGKSTFQTTSRMSLYLTTATASTTYQPIGSYLTTATAASTY